MRISGTEPSSVILSQTKSFQNLNIDTPKVPKQAEAKRDGVINPEWIFFHCRIKMTPKRARGSKQITKKLLLCLLYKYIDVKSA